MEGKAYSGMDKYGLSSKTDFYKEMKTGSVGSYDAASTHFVKSGVVLVAECKCGTRTVDANVDPDMWDEGLENRSESLSTNPIRSRKYDKTYSSPEDICKLKVGGDEMN